MINDLWKIFEIPSVSTKWSIFNCFVELYSDLSEVRSVEYFLAKYVAI